MKKIYSILTLTFFSTILFSTIINVPTDQPTIQEGIVAAVDTDTVLVAEGTYFENIDFIGKSITVASNFIIDGDETHIENTIINGSQPEDPDYGSCVIFVSGEDTTSVISGFTLTEGSGSYNQPPGANVGGGIICSNSSPKIVSNIVTNNSSIYSSGIVNNGDCSTILMDNVISYNTATNNSGGLTVIYGTDTSRVTVENCQIYGNTCGGYGGGVYIAVNGNAKLSNTSIYNNQAIYGSGISVYNSSLSLSYSSIYGNSASSDGGGIELENTNFALITNCTIYGNEAPRYGSQIDCWTGGGLEAVNTIIAGNSTNGSIYFNTFTPTFDYCDFYNSDGPDFDGPFIPPTLGLITTVNNNGDPCDEFMNILLEAMFVDVSSEDFHLSEFSPCIDAGDPTFPLDPYGTCVEIGRYCFDPTDIEDNTIVQTTNLLHQNYPNPFNPRTRINYTLRENSEVTIDIYNIKGQKVKQLVSGIRQQPEGQHSVIWNGKDDNNKPVSSGIYFYKLKTENYEKTKRMVLLK